MIIRKLKESERNIYKKLMRYSFSAQINNYENLDWPVDYLPMNWFYGSFEKEKLIAGVGVFPYEIKFLSQKFFFAPRSIDIPVSYLSF